MTPSFGQQRVQWLHEVPGDVHADDFQFGLQLLTRCHDGQTAGGGVRGGGLGERELARSGGGAAVAVEFVDLQEQVAAPRTGGEGGEGTDLGEAVGDRVGGLGAGPEVGEVRIGLAGFDPGCLVVGDAVDVGQRGPV